jgi:hypothetical protein
MPVVAPSPTNREGENASTEFADNYAHPGVLLRLYCSE